MLKHLSSEHVIRYLEDKPKKKIQEGEDKAQRKEEELEKERNWLEKEAGVPGSRRG